MAYPGQDLKYRITVTKQDFSLAEDLFMIVVKNSWGRVIRKVMKTDCFFDSEGRMVLRAGEYGDGRLYGLLPRRLRR